jgi:uncharacterized membrane protein HdeD (DUF308 family)
MSQGTEPSGPSPEAGTTYPGPQDLLAARWRFVLATGISAFVLGVALSLWPGETVRVLAALLACQLIIAGAIQVFLATATGPGASRWVFALGGALSGAAGLMLLLRPGASLDFLALAGGACVLVVGLVDLGAALFRRRARQRLWLAVRGLVGVVVGPFMMANPDWSLGVLVLLLCVWLIGYGFLTIVSALSLRAELRADPETSPVPHHLA